MDFLDCRMMLELKPSGRMHSGFDSGSYIVNTMVFIIPIRHTIRKKISKLIVVICI